MRSKDKDAYDCGADGGDQDPACGDILGVTDQGVEFRGGDVGEKLKGRIEGFGGPDGHDCEDDPTPLGRREYAEPSDKEDAARGEGVQPGIMLRTEHESHPSDGTAKTLDAARECQGFRVIEAE